MKLLFVFLSIVALHQPLCGQNRYEFSTYCKLNQQIRSTTPIVYTSKNIPDAWNITLIAVSATLVEAVGDALSDMGQINGNPDYKVFGKTFQAASLGAHYLYFPVLKNSETSWLWIPLIESFWRFILFDMTYNLTRGLPFGFIGNTSIYDKGLQVFSPPPGMRLFANCIFTVFVVSLTFDKF